MCIAIYKPADKVLSKELLSNCFDNNSDGAGFAYINTDLYGKKRLKVYKSLSFENFYKKYERATRIATDSPFLIHFRIKTHGPVDIPNCHPFYINKNEVFIHNGIISGVGYDKDVSDTRLFNDLILKQLPKGWKDQKVYQLLVESFIGFSKLVVLNVDKSFKILNESKGEWFEGCWMSNNSYKAKKSYNFNYSTTNATTTNYPVVVKGDDYLDGKKNKKYQVNPQTFVVCDFCDSPGIVRNMKFYTGSGEYISVCKRCANDPDQDTGLLLTGLEELSTAKYIQVMNNKKSDIIIDQYGYDSESEFYQEDVRFYM